MKNKIKGNKMENMKDFLESKNIAFNISEIINTYLSENNSPTDIMIILYSISSVAASFVHSISEEFLPENKKQTKEKLLNALFNTIKGIISNLEKIEKNGFH